MALHGTHGLCALALLCVLLCVLLTTARSFPAPRTDPLPQTDPLRCFTCPLQDNSERCNVTQQCLPDEVCALSKGFSGSRHVLSAQGCVKMSLCDTHEFRTHLGVRYNVSTGCCCRDQCNYTPTSAASMQILLGILQVVRHCMNASASLIPEQTSDSCAGYTPPPTRKTN